MEYWVYILVSWDLRHTYVGQTEDLQRRMAQHNAGKVRSTKAFRPWRILHTEGFPSRQEAKERELWYKTASGRRRIAELLRAEGI